MGTKRAVKLPPIEEAVLPEPDPNLIHYYEVGYKLERREMYISGGVLAAIIVILLIILLF